MGGPGLETFNPWIVYNSTLALDRENKLTGRIRIFQYTVDTNMEIPILRERLRNTYPLFGDEMFKVSGVGERVVSLPPLPAGAPRGNERTRENEEAALQFVAQQGWTYSEHSLQLATDKEITGVFEKVNAVTPIADLHWSVSRLSHRQGNGRAAESDRRRPGNSHLVVHERREHGGSAARGGSSAANDSG